MTWTNAQTINVVFHYYSCVKGIITSGVLFLNVSLLYVDYGHPRSRWTMGELGENVMLTNVSLEDSWFMIFIQFQIYSHLKHLRFNTAQWNYYLCSISKNNLRSWTFKIWNCFWCNALFGVAYQNWQYLGRDFI